MTQPRGPDDHTERFAPDDDATSSIDEGDDATQRFAADDDATHAMTPGDDVTRAMDAADDQTRMMDPVAHDEPMQTRRIAPVTGPTPQATERIHVPVRASVAPWLIAAFVALGLIIGGVLGYLQAEPSDDNVAARALVGPDGGVLTFDGGGRLEVPRGALPNATAITIRKEALDRQVRLGAADDARSTIYGPGDLDVYAFEPADLRFQQPVKITLPRDGDAEAVLVDSEQGARVIPAEGTGNTLTLATTSFSFDQ